ncbi:MAG: FtsX-like permease family protein [Myxococcales bacterium]|nr:FtsX-like permease family protein [Myxococcales bacterium]
MSLSVLDRKLLRDLSRMGGQVVTIALVVACGIASFIATKGTYDALIEARDGYYARQRFADLFAHLERAPEAVTRRLLAIEGVARVETQVVEQVTVPLPSLKSPALAELVSLPADRPPLLHVPVIRRGRLFQSGRSDEVVVLEAFADANGLTLGDRLPVVINGVLRSLRIVGVALAPQYLFTVAPGELFPDPKRFGALWMEQGQVAAAFRMEGAFNRALFGLQPGAEPAAVIDAINRELDRYGGSGAFERRRHLSDSMLRGELSQLEGTTGVLPAIFLGVAAFLINVVLSRLVQLQRTQIAVLKAVGYGNSRLGFHYLKLVSVIVGLGMVLGVSVGALLGDVFTELYLKFFRFPALEFQLSPRRLGDALGVSALAAIVGALSAVRSAVRLPPAEAMRPEPPARYRRGLVAGATLSALFGQAASMVAREVGRRPLRTLLSSLGIAMAVAVMVSGRFAWDSIDRFMQVQFELAQRQDMSVTFRGSVPESALSELRALAGVQEVEGQRMVAVRFIAGHHQRDSTLIGHPPHARLRRVLDRDARELALPPQGVVLTRTLAEILELEVGDEVRVEVLEGQRLKSSLFVAGLVDEVMGLQGHMQLPALSRLLREQPRLSMAHMRVDPERYGAVYDALSQRPGVLGISTRTAAIEMFRQQTGGQMAAMTLILTIFASIIACGVIYNNARVALSTRSRDLASLRVLGFRRREIAAILLGELGLQVLLAIVPGLIIGTLMAEGMMSQNDPELYRFPVVISGRTYAFATLVTLGAALLSALLVRGRLDRLDLIGVLKTRE